MDSSPYMKGLLLFLLLQISLLLYAQGQFSNSTSMDNAMNETLFNNTWTMLNETTQGDNNTAGSNITNITNSTNSTNSANTTLLSCRISKCNSSSCYSTFMSTNATLCSARDKYCELMKKDDSRYSVSCVSSCSTSCINASQWNCSAGCCSSETCLTSTLAALANASMTMTPTTVYTTPTTRMSTASTVTPANNGKKCHKISCNGDICYQGNTNLMLCAPTQNYCMLKKTTSGTVVSWTASCIEDCSKETVCTSSTANCFLECCNATTTASCLKLTGQVNMPNSASRGRYSPMLLMISLLPLWLLSVAAPA